MDQMAHQFRLILALNLVARSGRSPRSRPPRPSLPTFRTWVQVENSAENMVAAERAKPAERRAPPRGLGVEYLR